MIFNLKDCRRMVDDILDADNLSLTNEEDKFLRDMVVKKHLSKHNLEKVNKLYNKVFSDDKI